MKAAPKAAAKKAPPKAAKPAGPGAIAAGGGLGAVGESAADDGKPAEVEAYHATGIDNALDLLEVVTAKMDKASVGSQAANLERHPEVRSGRSSLECGRWADHVLQQRRFKAAFEAYKERELPIARKEVRWYIRRASPRTHAPLSRYLQHPGLRLQQYHVRTTFLPT